MVSQSVSQSVSQWSVRQSVVSGQSVSQSVSTQHIPLVQVTSMWCSLSALAVVTYLAVDLHLTVCRQHADSTCNTPEVAGGGLSGPSAWRRSGRGGKDCANTLLFVVFTVTLFIASLPVAGYGPEVRPANGTCDSWLVYTPSSGPRRTFFVAFLSFGFLNLLTMTAAVGGATWVLRAGSRRAGRPGVLRYTEESGDTQKREAIHSGALRYTAESGDTQKREAIHSGALRYTAESRDTQKREAIHSGTLRYTEESGDTQKREAIHSEELRYTPESSDTQKTEAIHSDTQKREAIHSGGLRYTEESDTPLDPLSASHCYKMTGFILVNQAMWLPTLVREPFEPFEKWALWLVRPCRNSDSGEGHFDTVYARCAPRHPGHENTFLERNDEK